MGAGLCFAQDWTPACAGDPDQEVRFHSGPCDINGVILGIAPKIPVVGFEVIDAVAPRWAYRDSRDEPENDTVGGAGFRKVIAGRRLGPVFVRAPPVPITERAVEEHPERCAGALHEAHENAQHRLQRKLDERWVAWAVCAVSCSFDAGHYKSANTPADLAPRFPPGNSPKILY